MQRRLTTIFCGALTLAGSRASAEPTPSATPLAVPTPSGSWTGPRLDDGAARLRALLGGTASIRLDRHFGTVRTADRFGPMRPIDTTADAVLGWLKTNRRAFGLAHPARELSLVRAVVRDPKAGQSYFHFARRHRGLPIVEAELTVLLDRKGRPARITGHYPVTLDLATAPVIDAERAIAGARRRAHHRAEPKLFEPTATLVVFAGGKRPRLAYEVAIGYSRRSQLPYHELIYIDATTGVTLAERERIWTAGMPAACTGADWTNTQRNLGCAVFDNGNRLLVDVGALSGDNGVGTFDARNAGGNNLGAVIQQATPIPADANGAVSHVNGVSGHYAVGRAFQYMREVLMRPSWNHSGSGTDKSQLNLVNFGQSMPNAFATVLGTGNDQFSLNVFGNGDGTQLTEFTRCVDVAGHELFHNVVQATAGLVYENQSGAMNEHFADAFGVAIDKRYEDDDDLVGEHCVPAGSNPIRSMSDPAMGLSPQPGHMSMYQTLPNTKDGDNGGVHVNSGIPNRAFYLFYTAAGVETAEQVWYRALNQGGLMSRSEFRDLVSALVAACGAVGDGMTCQALRTALGTVGLHVAAQESAGGGCPPNSAMGAEGCECNDGFNPSADGTSCEAVAQANCPDNASQVGEECYCNDGFEPSPDGAACVGAREAACPDDAHRVGDHCVCDDGYVGYPDAPEGGCWPNMDQCGPYAHLEGGGCVCNDGYQLDAAGTDCEPSGNGCGDETWYGRCIGKVLVYCDDQDPMAPVVERQDCAATSQACGKDAEGFFDCVAAADPCGAITEAGTCTGSKLQYCDGEGDERGLFEVDCATYGSACETNGGVADCAAPAGGADAGTNNNNGGMRGIVAPTPKDDDCSCSTIGDTGSGGLASGLFLLLMLPWRRR